MTFHEKSAWVCLISILAVFVPYFLFVFQNPMAFVGLFFVAVVVLVLLLVGFHVVNAIFTPMIKGTGDVVEQDERDQGIETWAAKISGVVLGFSVIIWCLNAMFGIPILAAMNAESAVNSTVTDALASFSIPAFQALTWVHALFAAFVFANLTYYFLIVLAYRRSA